MNEEKIGIYITVRNNEMQIASKIYLLNKILKESDISNYQITIFDNGSTDRTSEISRKSGANIIKFNDNRSIETIINHLKKNLDKSNIENIAFIDGNSSVEPGAIVEMIRSFIFSEKRTGMGYIAEQEEGKIVDINGIIFKMNILQEISFDGIKIGNEEDLLHLGMSLGMDIDKKTVMNAEKGMPLTRIPLKSGWDLLNQYKKANPLKYYGSICAAFLIFSLIPGIYLIGNFVKYSHLHYHSFFIFIGLTGIGVILLSIGLILNALNVLSDKVRGMM